MMSENTAVREAGRELDALVAEKVMGWVWARSAARFGNPPREMAILVPKGDFPWQQLRGDEEQRRSFSHVPRFSRDIAAAFNALAKLGGPVTITRTTRDSVIGWTVCLGAGAPWWAETLPLAICRAALAAVEFSR